MTTRNTSQTEIFRFYPNGEARVGYVDEAGTIYRSRWHEGLPIGSVDEAGRVFRHMTHDVRELGQVDERGTVYSHGLFEGGALGWLEPDGVVMQGGFILGEDEVGRVEGPRSPAAAAALLLIFLPEEAEADRRAAR